MQRSTFIKFYRLKKSTLISVLFFFLIGGKIFLQKEKVVISTKKVYKEHSGSREYWRKRIGAFDSNAKFINSIKKARKQISRVTNRRPSRLSAIQAKPPLPKRNRLRAAHRPGNDEEVSHGISLTLPTIS